MALTKDKLLWIYEAVGEAVARARRGDGPTFIEAQRMPQTQLF